jgi:hypothetical protein
MKNWMREEVVLLGSVLVALAFARWGPVVPQHVQYHDFADQRTWLGLPCAMDVLTNLPFAVAGLWGLGRAAVMQQADGWTVRLGLTQLFFAGLVLTFVGSSYYHLQRDDSGLAWDRAGMVGAFAGLLGMAVADRISTRAAAAMAAMVTGAGLMSVSHWASTGNLLPWVVVQGGGMLLVFMLALRPPVAQAWQLPLVAVTSFYALAKLFELGDAVVFAATNGWISGHSLKHVFAAAAAWPVLWVMHNRSKMKTVGWLTASVSIHKTSEARETR